MVGRLGLAPSIAFANGFTVRPIAISGHHPKSRKLNVLLLVITHEQIIVIILLQTLLAFPPLSRKEPRTFTAITSIGKV